ncbi:MAG: beta-N-acetylhexosaminidase [Anaerolineae bacterium]|nr:beta-N-acetylhexosaminidase [Anaerolineae bacterium]
MARQFQFVGQRLAPVSLCLFMALATGLGWSAAQDDLLSELTLEQRVAQLFIVNLYGGQMTEAGRDFLRDYQPGGVVLLGDNLGDPAAITRLTNQYQQTIAEAGGIPLLIAVDQEGGPISHLREGFTTFPTPALMTAAGDADLAYRVGQAMGRELRAVGVNMNLAPVADLETNRNNPIITRRSFGSDPQQVSAALGPFIEGMQAEGVLATAKHFPGHGDSADDSHTTLPVIDLSRERLETVELIPFKAAIEAGVSTVMAAHIWYPALEAEANRPASLSAAILSDLLREEMGFDGLIMTDALDMDAIDTVYSYPSAVLAAVQAGADVVIAAHIGLNAQMAAINAVAEAVRRGEIAEARIDESARRVLAAKAAFGVLDWQPLAVGEAAARLDLAGHEALVQELFDAGVTIARDVGGVLPLRDDTAVAMIYPATRTQIMRECSPYSVAVQWVGVSGSPSETEIAWAVDAARRQDVAVVFTQNAETDRAQQALVRALPPEKTVVVALWSPYDWLAFPQVAGYMVTYSPLNAAVPAACKVLFGAVESEARLSIALDGITGG